MALNSTPPKFRHGAKASKAGFEFASLAYKQLRKITYWETWLVYRDENSPWVKGKCHATTQLITFLLISKIPLLTKLKRNYLQLIIRQTGLGITYWTAMSSEFTQRTHWIYPGIVLIHCCLHFVSPLLVLWFTMLIISGCVWRRLILSHNISIFPCWKKGNILNTGPFNVS